VRFSTRGVQKHQKTLPGGSPCPCQKLLAEKVEKKNKGGHEKKMTKVTYICRSAKKKVVTYFILFLFLFLSIFVKAFFWRFVTRGVQKHEKNFFLKKPISGWRSVG
jgi:hypothetical protein